MRKLLEIGTGCAMTNGRFSSPELWRNLFPAIELWGADFDEACIQKYSDRVHELKLNVLIGDQADIYVLQRWVNVSGGGFDVIIDDGGHTNMQMYNTFITMFDLALKPGGVFFMEDIQACRNNAYIGTSNVQYFAECTRNICILRLNRWRWQAYNY